MTGKEPIQSESRRCWAGAEGFWGAAPAPAGASCPFPSAEAMVASAAALELLPHGSHRRWRLKLLLELLLLLRSSARSHRCPCWPRAPRCTAALRHGGTRAATGRCSRPNSHSSAAVGAASARSLRAGIWFSPLCASSATALTRNAGRVSAGQCKCSFIYCPQPTTALKRLDYSPALTPGFSYTVERLLRICPSLLYRGLMPVPGGGSRPEVAPPGGGWPGPPGDPAARPLLRPVLPCTANASAAPTRRSHGETLKARRALRFVPGAALVALQALGDGSR